MLDGARTMFNAYQQTTTKRDSIDQVKLGLKECTQVSFYSSYIIIQKYYIITSVESSKETIRIFLVEFDFFHQSFFAVLFTLFSFLIED